MKIMVVGGGGREHAIIKKLKENKTITEIYALPGNGGIAADATCVSIGATDIPALVSFATENRIDYAVVAPDDPLVLGAVDAVRAAQIDVASTYNFTPYVVASLLFILMSVPFILLNDWYTERLRKRELSGGTV